MKINKYLLRRIEVIAEACGLTTNEMINELLRASLKGHNQTQEEWLNDTTNEMLGTGMFLLPDVEGDTEYSVKKIFVRDITYIDCVKRGRLVTAFKWIPHSVALFEQLSNSS